MWTGGVGVRAAGHEGRCGEKMMRWSSGAVTTGDGGCGVVVLQRRDQYGESSIKESFIISPPSPASQPSDTTQKASSHRMSSS